MSKDFSSLLGGALVNKQLNDSTIRERIIIREEFRDLIPQLKSEELEQLEKNILKDGVHDPLIIWPVGDDFVLIDGHNRYSICLKHKLDFPIKKIDFTSHKDALDWMVKNQLGRRNLSPEQQSYLRGLRYNQEKMQGKRTDLTFGQSDQKLESESTAKRLAKEYDVSEKTIIRDAQYAEGLDLIGKDDPQLKKEILHGTTKVSKEEVQRLSKGRRAKDTLKPKTISSIELMCIAFEYAKSETNSFEEVCKRLDIDPIGIAPKEFFSRWNSLR